LPKSNKGRRPNRLWIVGLLSWNTSRPAYITRKSPGQIPRCGRTGCRPHPPAPWEPVPSVPPVGQADRSPLRYGGLWAASSPLVKNLTLIDSITHKKMLAGQQKGGQSRDASADPRGSAGRSAAETHFEIKRGANAGSELQAAFNGLIKRIFFPMARFASQRSTAR